LIPRVDNHLIPVYLTGFGLASSLGANLNEALVQLARPHAPQQRAVKGLLRTVPYHAIAYTAADWKTRCADLIRQVVAEAGYTAGDNPGHRAALYLASSSTYVGSMEKGESHFENLNDFVAAIAAMLDWQGPITHINSACTSSLNALLEAKSALECGCIDEALIIGLELDNQLSLAGFAGLQLLSSTRAQPFHAQRDGQILGEAVAALWLSKQPGRWRLAGGAHVIDSSEVSSASVVAYRTMLEQTLRQAQWEAAQIDVIKVQASGSVTNDAVEAEAIYDFFTPLKMSAPALITLKPQIGHTLGASGAAEIALLLSMLEQGQWPPCQHARDAELKVSLAPQPPQRMTKLLACILGFGGSHACVAIEAAW
jgi:3-oxoacyl-[acyl-carrier-protein] synthase I